MKIRTYYYKNTETFECPFGKKYFYDYMVAYHGTSNIAENDIDKHGFIWSDSLFTRDEVNAVLDVFKQLLWCGQSLGGLFVLSQYAKRDFERNPLNKTKPIFFASSSHSALLYSSIDFAGGETARALRHAFEDLRRFLFDKNFRNNHFKKIFNSMKSLLQFNFPSHLPKGDDDLIEPKHITELWQLLDQIGIKYPVGLIDYHESIRPVQFSETWLANKLSELDPIYKKCMELKNKYKYGVIYAVRFENSDLDAIEFDPSHGLVSYKPVEPRKIVEKVRVYFIDEFQPLFTDEERFHKSFCKQGLYSKNIY